MRTVRLSLRRSFALLVISVLSVGYGLIVGPTVWMDIASSGHRHRLADAPTAPVAIVLGSGLQPDGTPSPFLAARLDIAHALYRDGAVTAVLVSGDNGRHEYDEVSAMRTYLIDHGVPSRKVVGDYAGFDTYDTCVRANTIFGVEQALIITQTYHLARAVALCRAVGIDTEGVGDDTVRRFARNWRIAQIREVGANVKAALDLLTRRDPVYLGPPEPGIRIALTE